MSQLTEMLSCPRCRSALDGLSCKACQIEFPRYDGVPWLVADPVATRFDWRNRWQMALQELESQQRAARAAIESNPRPATLDRLTNLAEGYAAQHRALKVLLKSLGLARPANLDTYLALKTRLPSRMGLTSYQANVFRDWCWGTAENRASLEPVVEALDDARPQNLLVLGAGAGRLAYDVHQALAPDLTVALELNPYLTTVLQTLAGGASVTLTEFPLAPSPGKRSAIPRELTAPAPAGPGFEVVLADAMRAPFQPASFDAVITPWLMDVIDAAPAALLSEINALLKPGGCWIYHGSLAFERASLAENLNLEELEALAFECGFSVDTSTEQVSPYLDSPDSRHGRREQILTLKTTKIESVPLLPRHQNLPDWIARGRDPVPLLPAFQSQAMATRIHAFIMSLIDGQRSLKDMADLMEAQQLMSKEEAETAIRGFLIKMYDEASTGRRV